MTHVHWHERSDKRHDGRTNEEKARGEERERHDDGKASVFLVFLTLFYFFKFF